MDNESKRFKIYCAHGQGPLSSATHVTLARENRKMKKAFDGRTQRIYIVDSFARGPFSGNPAAVCIYEDADLYTDVVLQKMAAEMNLSETCFAYPLKTARGRYSLRWFTPTTEVPLCGHGTLATAHVLFFELGVDDVTELTFETQRGDLTVQKSTVEPGSLVMDFPQGAPSKVSCALELTSQILAAVGLSSDDASVLEVWQCNRTRKLTLIIDSAAAIPKLSPDMNAIMAVQFPESWIVKGIIVASDQACPSEFDFVSRYFAPLNGIPEDPVTGSAHTVLAVVFGKRLGKTNMMGFQQSARGGQVGVELVAKNSRVKLYGKAITMLEGAMRNIE